MAVFSRRNATKPDTFKYDIPEQTRNRMLSSLNHFGGRGAGSNQFDLTEVMREMQEKLLMEYGAVYGPSYSAASRSSDPAIEHFLCCDDEMALDFIELIFTCRKYRGGNVGVEIINRIFQEDGIGYELTPLVQVEVDREGELFGSVRPYKAIETTYPEIIRKDTEYTHEQIVRPCLHVLGDIRFTTANAEMLKAHSDYKDANYPHAITSCGAAFESVLKTICEAKKWTYDKNKDTCASLINVCNDKGLFYSFYTPTFVDLGTIRNKLGSVHGRGPDPDHKAEKEHADHMIQVTSAHILLLVALAKL